MKRTILLLVALLLVAGSAGTMGVYASGSGVPLKPERTDSVSTAAWVAGGHLTEAPLDIVPEHTTGFEPAEGFVPGPIGGQNGWTMFAASPIEGHIDLANPSGGVQHLRISYDPVLGPGIYTGAFTPDLGPRPVVPSDVSVDVAISATGGADYIVAPQAPSQDLLTAEVEFDWLGNIWILDDLGGGVTMVDTGVAWNVGPYTNLRIEVNPWTNTIDYYYGGALFYSSVGGVFAGTTIEEVVFVSDNWHDADVGDFDNLVTNHYPTAVELASFTAVTQGSAIQLKWETATELDNLGFNAYRSGAAEGERVQLNAALIPAQNPGTPLGATYRFLDETAAPGVIYYYWLEDVDAYGAATVHGPVSGQAQALWRLLPARPRYAPAAPGLQSR